MKNPKIWKFAKHFSSSLNRSQMMRISEFLVRFFWIAIIVMWAPKTTEKLNDWPSYINRLSFFVKFLTFHRRFDFRRWWCFLHNFTFFSAINSIWEENCNSRLWKSWKSFPYKIFLDVTIFPLGSQILIQFLQIIASVAFLNENLANKENPDRKLRF